MNIEKLLSKYVDYDLPNYPLLYINRVYILSWRVTCRTFEINKYMYVIPTDRLVVKVTITLPSRKTRVPKLKRRSKEFILRQKLHYIYKLCNIYFSIY